MSDLPPDVYLARGLLIYGDLARGGSIARGFRIAAPDLLGSTEEFKEEVHDRLVRLCGSLTDDERLQWQWRCTADYIADLDCYDAKTAAGNDQSPTSTRARRSSSYRRMHAERKLRRQDVVLFATVRIRGNPPLIATPAGLAAHNAVLIDQYVSQFAQFEDRIRTILGTDIAVAALTDLQTFEAFYRFLNPTIDALPSPDFERLFHPERSMQELCLNSDILARPNGLYFDGHYHGLLTLKRLGHHTYMGICNALTGLSHLDYQITVNITPRDVDRETALEEHAAEILEAEQEQKFKRTRQVAIDKKDAKIRRLASSHVKPYDMLFVIRAWAKSEAALSSLLGALRDAVQSMRGAEAYQIALPASTRQIFCATWPGHAFTPYSARHIYVEDPNLCDLIPFTSTFTGLLAEADAIYQGPQRQLVGIQTVVNGTPQQTVIFGASRSGKSDTLQDLLRQTAPLTAYTVIVEEGASHTEFTKSLGGRTISVHPEAPYCINYFDTGGLPLTRTHRSFAVALAAHMAGRISDERGQTSRLSQISFYVDRLYTGQYFDWAKRHRDLIPQIQREALAINLWRARLDAEAEPLDAWQAVRQGLDNKDPEICSFVANLAADDILKFSREPATERAVFNHAFSYFKPEDYPQHSQFAESMLLDPSPDHPAADIREIATNLKAWSRDSGAYGGIFDGVTNVPLGGRVDHFELARIPNSQPELKSAIALLITSVVRNHIYKLPKAARKQVILEELARYINIPDAARLTEETFAQLAKTGTWVCAVVQQYAQFQSSPVRPIIMGNTKQFLIFRQLDTKDLEAIAEAVALPAAMKDAVRKFQIPAEMTADDRYAAFCYHVASRSPVLSGTVFNIHPKP